MRRSLILALVLLGCSKKPASPELALAALPAAAGQPGPAAAPADPGPSGRVAERIDASQYTYLRLETSAGEVWAAVPKSRVKVGAQATILNAMWMTDFKSTTLSRTFPRIAFGTLEGESPEANTAEASPQPAAGRSPGMFALEAAQSSQAPARRALAPAVEPSEIKLPKVSARDGRTIAEVYAQRAALKDQRIQVRGKVVKAVDGVMGKSWLHLHDGTGSGASADLAVASDTSARVGEVVVVTGTVHLDRDLGAGYRYEVLVEDAELKRE